MQTREEHGVKGFLLCKKAGDAEEKRLFTSTRAKWQDLVAGKEAGKEVSEMQRRPEIMGKVSKMLAGDSGATESSPSSSSLTVKAEDGKGPTRSIVPGDHVQVQRGATDLDYRGKTGTVERFQLGRVVVNFSGTLKAVKEE